MMMGMNIVRHGYIFFGLLIHAYSAFACIYDGSDHLSFFTSATSMTTSEYTGQSSKIKIGQCKPSADFQYLMVATGPDILNLNYQRGWSYTGYFHDDFCRLEKPDYVQEIFKDYDTRLKEYKNKSQLIHDCLKIDIMSIGGEAVRLPEEQEGCKVDRHSPNSVTVRGGYCFIKIQQKTEIDLEYSFDDQCIARLKANADFPVPKDVQFASSIFMAGDATGHSVDLEPLTRTEMNYTYEATESETPLSTPFGLNQPRWFASQTIETHYAGFKYEQVFDLPELEFYFLADNSCKVPCENNECQKPCQYRSAFGAEALLYELSSEGDERLIHNEYLGAMIPADWQGIFPTTKMQLAYNPFQVGRKYRVRVKLAYPDAYFRLAGQYLANFKINMIDLHRIQPGISSLGSLAGLPALNSRHKTLPIVKGVPDLRHFFDKENISYSSPLETLESYLSSEVWPPFLEEICNADQTKCENIFDTGGSTAIEIDLTFQGDGFVTSRVLKHSNIDSVYQVTDPLLPEIRCD